MKIRSLPTWLTAGLLFLVIGIGAQVVFSQGWLSGYWQQVLMLGTLMAISALGLNLKYGYAGLFALGQAAFYGIGAYSSALITKDWVSGWSGNPAGGLAGVLALEAGLILAVIAISYLKIGPLRHSLSNKLSRWLTPFEASVLATPVMLVAGVLIIVVIGGGSGWLVRQAVLSIVPPVLGALPPAISQQVIFALALLAGAVLAGLAGFLIGLPLLNLTYDYLCISTLGFGIIMYVFFNNADKLIPTLKGARGMVGIPNLTTWPWVFACAVVALVVMRNFIYSSTGRAILALRDDPIAAETMGINTSKLKILAYALGCAYAGLAGGLYAHLYSFLHPSNFTWLKSIDPFVMVVFGGVGSMTGTILGAYVFEILLEGLRVLPAALVDWRYVIYALIVLIVMLFRPQGIMGTKEWGFLKLPRIVNRKHKQEVPAEATPIEAQAVENQES
ncbi:MAG: branched-chain amino acid ABC transporter permease [Anaerolineae bacterium]|nr:branched-chain amino acid ABC transporter permease [Anaerolineae bacterium]